MILVIHFFLFLFIHLLIYLFIDLFLSKFRSVFVALSNTYDKYFGEKKLTTFSRFEWFMNALLQRPCNTKWTQYIS